MSHLTTATDSPHLTKPFLPTIYTYIFLQINKHEKTIKNDWRAIIKKTQPEGLISKKNIDKIIWPKKFFLCLNRHWNRWLHMGRYRSTLFLNQTTFLSFVISLRNCGFFKLWITYISSFHVFIEYFKHVRSLFKI